MLRVEAISHEEVKPWILKKHYAKRMPSISYAYGAFVDGKMLGVCTFGVPASPSLCVGICGEEYRNRVLELNRLCVDDDAPFPRSQFLATCLKRLSQICTNGKPRNMYGFIVVSYADTGMGHIGKVYQATNFIYTGCTKERTDIGMEDGTHSRHYDKSMDKKKNRKHRSAKHRYVFFVGGRLWKNKAMNCMNYKEQPYPDGISTRYNSGGRVETQNLLL